MDPAAVACLSDLSLRLRLAGADPRVQPQGTILYRYRDASGPGTLNHPSLAELLPSGVFMANDDYNDRMVAIDPATGALVWQYGITGKPGTAPGNSTPRMASTCCCRTARHRRTR